ncbi:conserved hypothetical protein [Candidatus Brocadia pituitae]|nr:conserved hypothetical protein [Candidatus Brocadia pituitae]
MVSLSADGLTATFIPGVDLANSTLYTATITTGAKDLNNNAMATNFVWSFTTAATGPISGQQAFYAFDEGSGTIANDSSGNGNNGNIIGATWTTGKSGGGLSFDGRLCQQNDPFRRTETFAGITTAVWIRTSATDTGERR